MLAKAGVEASCRYDSIVSVFMQEITSSLLIMLRCWTGLFQDVHSIETTIKGSANKSFFIFQNLCEDKH
jgi:hypothetical protein